MSYATTENRTSVRALDSWSAQLDAIERAEQCATDEIQAAFGTLLRRWSAKNLLVPTVKLVSGILRETTVTADEAIRDEMSYGYVHAELVAVLEKSDCPLVQTLREAIGKSWAKHNAADVASYRVEA